MVKPRIKSQVVSTFVSTHIPKELAEGDRRTTEAHTQEDNVHPESENSGAAAGPYPQLGVPIKLGAPQNGWFVVEHPIKMDDLDDLEGPLF